MKGIIAVLALALVLQTAFTLSKLQGRNEKTAGNQPLSDNKTITAELKRLSTDVAKLKTRVAVLEKGTTTPTSTPVPVPHCVVDRERVNVREGPGVIFAVIGTVARGEGFDVQARNVVGDWYRFCCVGGSRGWIYAPLLNCTDVEIILVAKDIPPVPPTNTPAPPPTNTPAPNANTSDPGWPKIAAENRCSPYDPDDYSYPQSVESQIVRQMGGRIYGPYTGRHFASTSETDIEHIVARSEAHDSGMCAASVADRRAFARDLLNLTLASPSVNRHQKGAKDVAEWLPAMNVCWYVRRVVDVKSAYDLTMDSAESRRAREVLESCNSTELQFTAAPIPTPTRSLTCPRNCTEAHDMGMSNMGTGHRCYKTRLDRDGDGIACER